MKKSLFLLGLLTTTLALTACGSKNFNMTFEEALDAASKSQISDIISENSSSEQSREISGNYSKDSTKVTANLSSNGKQNLNSKDSESSTNFDVNIDTNEENVKVSWNIDLKTSEDALYLNLSSLNLTWSEDLSLVAMMTAWFQNQWFYIPLTGLDELPNTLSYIKDDELNTKIKDLVINEWSTTYEWKYSQFNGYNARKFSIDNDKLNELIKSSLNKASDEEDSDNNTDINIENFEWYLVITWKDKVTTIFEKMDISDEESTMSINGFFWEEIEMYISGEDDTMISVIAHKKWSKYDVSLDVSDLLSIKWTINTKISKSSINIEFNATLVITDDIEEHTTTEIPFKGYWSYKTISEFSVSLPENAQDLTEMLWDYLGNMLWWDTYEDIEWFEDIDYLNEDIDYDDYYTDEDVENNDTLESSEESTTENE